MVKILLVFEDFNELTITESYLKKVGFDVIGISNEILVHDQILTFNPDIIVASGSNQKVSSFSIGQKMKDNQRFQGKVVIIVPKDVRPSPQDILRIKMDGIIETPVNPEKLIQVLCRVVGQPSTTYIDKFQKARLSDPELKRLIIVTSIQPPAQGATVSTFSPPGVAIDDPKRIERYKKFTEGMDIDVKASTHQRQDLKEKQKEMKKNWNFDELEEQDDLRRQFAEALFKKK